MNAMAENTSNSQVPGIEPGDTSGYVKNKIKGSKKDTSLARARKEHWPSSIAKVIKKAISISELVTGEDQAASLRVLREAKRATHRIFDPATKQLIEVPDHKTRLAAITLELAYTEGRPVERQIVATGDFEDLNALMTAVRETQIGREMFPSDSLHKIVEGQEVVPALLDIVRKPSANTS